MRPLSWFTGTCLSLLFLPAAAHAQAAVMGQIRDTSGAVLPGVTVELSSPVLIEKVRTAATDGNGRYQLVDLRPGVYTVTFMLTGFNTVRHEDVVLTGSAALTVDAELRVGGLEETISVLGGTSQLDLTSSTRQTAMTADVIDALPTSRNYLTLARLIPAAVGGGPDVGGSTLQLVGGSVRVHGSRIEDQRVTLNGINTMTLQVGGNQGGQIPDMGSASEVTLDHTSVSADLPTGGVRINFIPRDGGNTFSNATFFTFSHGDLQGNNFTDELRAAGLRAPNQIKRNWDLNQSFGGRIRRDSIWYWMSLRYNGVENYAPVFENRNAYDPTRFLYDADTSERGLLSGRSYNSSLRLTWQATPRNRIAGTYKADAWCQCPLGVSAFVAPEAAWDYRFPRLRQEHAEWTSPVTDRLLLEAVVMHLYERWGLMHPQAPRGSAPEFEAVAPQMISVTEQSTALTYRAPATENNNTRVPNWAYRAAVTYVTGSHNLKVGFNRVHGFQETTTYSLNPLAYRFNFGEPNRITLRAYPFTFRNNQDNDIGVFAQDRWRFNRATLGLALRYDYFGASFPEQRVDPTTLAPNRSFVFPAQDNLSWHDVTYRTAFNYDLRGDGKTALKLTANKYLRGQTLNALGTEPNPVNTLSNIANRSWTDSNRDFVPDCDLLNPALNRECGAIDNQNFGTVVPGATFDPLLMTGFGHRESNWEFAAGVQHEVLPRVSIDIGYFRRIWQNFRVTDNLALTPNDFDVFSMTVPSDPRLPGGGGYTLGGLVALKQQAFGRPTQNHNTLDRVYGEQIEHWNGFDVTASANLRDGLTLNGGVSTGKTVEDDCEIVAGLPEALNIGGAGTGVPVAWHSADLCQRATPFLTNVKGYGVYLVPRLNVQVAATFRSVPGNATQAIFNANNAYLAANSTLGRPLAGGAANIAIALLERDTMYLDRRNELDLRFGYIIRAGRSRSVISLDLYNATNSSAVLNANQNFSAWLTPTAILNARLAKISLELDF